MPNQNDVSDSQSDPGRSRRSHTPDPTVPPLNKSKSELPKWQPDGESQTCSRCVRKFTITRRRHHCRLCGQLVCFKCSSMVTYVGRGKIRVCNLCESRIGDSPNLHRADSARSLAARQSLSSNPPDPDEIENESGSVDNDSDSDCDELITMSPSRRHSLWVYALAATSGEKLQVGKTFIHVVSAKGLPAADANGKSDPYCVLELGEETQKTKIIFKNLNPVWDESFLFEVADPTHALVFNMYDHDRLSEDDWLCSSQIALDSLADQKVHEMSLTLTDKDGNPAGTLEIKAQYVYSKEAAFWAHIASEDKPAPEKEEKLDIAVLVANYTRLMNLVWPVIEFLMFVLSLLAWEEPYKSGIAYAILSFLSYNGRYIPTAFGLVFIFHICREYAKRQVRLAKTNVGGASHEDSASLVSGLTSIMFPKYYKELFLWAQVNMGWYCEILEWIVSLFDWTYPSQTKGVLAGIVVYTVATVFVEFAYIALVILTYLFLMWTKPYAIVYSFMFKAAYSTSILFTQTNARKKSKVNIKTN
eukprot:GFYU01013555.1.p1 GENE.GFYU01013555.1~~GFYU01013555.1.p1  ORF type:complete len:530 (+),score=138.25 GFYU01013555.1:166-1755(+)